MADDYRSGTCSTQGGSWWNPKRNTITGVGTRFEETAAVSCSTAITDLEAKSRSYNDSPGSGSGNSDIGSSISDSTLQLPLFGLSSTIDWSQSLMSSSEKTVTSLDQMDYFRHDQQTLELNQVHASTTESRMNPFTQSFILEQPQVGSCPDSAPEGTVDASYDSMGPATYNYPSSMVQALLETSTRTRQSIYNGQSTTNYAELLQPSWSKFPRLLQSSSLKQNQGNQLQLSNEMPFWNASIQSQFASQTIQPKSSNSSVIESLSHDSAQESCSSAFKKSDTETGFKKPRIETPSPLPTFKVRKEKLGDRITALQQLVSPFGKVLSTPYLKNGSPNPIQQQKQESEGPKQDLRSRGLCLVPVASTYPVASETTTDFWHPTFGGTFR